MFNLIFSIHAVRVCIDMFLPRLLGCEDFISTVSLATTCAPGGRRLEGGVDLRGGPRSASATGGRAHCSSESDPSEGEYC